MFYVYISNFTLTSYFFFFFFFFFNDTATTEIYTLSLHDALPIIGIGAMGFAGTSMVVATHVELAHTHTGGMPVGIHQFCLSSRRATARLFPSGTVEFRVDPEWFTDYYRRQGIE